jgi:phosphate transport system protein
VRVSFGEELAALEAALQEEGDLVLRALRSSLNALARGDEELAEEVIAFDDEVDRRYAAIETGVQSLLARQTPVAADLRLVLAVLRVNLHLERTADYCVTVAKLTKLMGGLDVSDDAINRSLEDMGRRAEQMIRVALDAFAARNAEQARTLVELIDRANRKRSRTCSRSATRRRNGSTGCGCSSSRAASSGSATMRSTSASRWPTSSPASCASSATRRTLFERAGAYP